MKKVLVVLVFLLSFSLTACVKDDDNDDPNPVVETENSGLGQTVNIVLADNYNDFIEGYSVLNSADVADITVRATNEEDTYIEEFSSSTLEDLKSSSEVGFSFGVGAEAQFNGMFAGVSSEYESSSSIEYSTFSSQYFYVYEKSVLKNRMYFQNYLEQDYSSMLSSTYLDALNDLESGDLSYNAFFNRYGSHLIVSAYYGGKLNAYYSIVTSKTKIDSTVSSQLKTSAKGGLEGVGSTEAEMKQNFADALSVNTEEIETSFTAKAIGGSTFIGSSLSDFQSSQEAWSESFNSDESYVLMDYADDGLVGLWDILPDEYASLKAEMIAAFEVYYNQNVDSMLLKFSNVSNVLQYKSTTPHTIEDNGLYGLNSSISDFDQVVLTPMMEYADENHVFQFEITLHMNEVLNGYQEVWIYNDHIDSAVDGSTNVSRNSAQSKGMVTGYQYIDFGGDTLTTSSNDETLTLFVSGTDIRELMYLKYDAHGDNNDTWQLHRVNITITAIPVTKVLDNDTSTSPRRIIDTGVNGLGVSNNEKTDPIDLSSFSGQLTDEYVYTFILQIDMAQVHFGYSGFYLYTNNTATSNETITVEESVALGLVNSLYDFEYPAYENEFDYAYTDVDVTNSVVYVILQVRGDQLFEQMYLRYDAKGENDDDWDLYSSKVYVFNELIE